MEEGENCDRCGVRFDLEGVSVLPMLRRTARGFAIVPGAGVLTPLTPLQIRAVSPVELKEERVMLSGLAAGGYVLGGLGTRLEGCRIIFRDGECWVSSGN
jgi:hypothetical protein